MDHQKSSPDLTTVYQIAVVVLLVACLSVLAAILLKTDSRTEYQAALQEYKDAMLIHREEVYWHDHLSDIGSEKTALSFKRISNNKNRVKEARDRLERFSSD